MRSPGAVFETLPSEILTMFYRNIDNVVDLQNLMLASPHVWRHLAIERQTPSILDNLLQNGSVHSQLALAVRIAAHLRCESPSLMELLSDIGLEAFDPGLSDVFYALNFPNPEKEFLEALPRDMKPSEARRLLTTSSAIHATTSRCVDHHLRRLHSLRPLTVVATDGVEFDLQGNKWADLPTSPRSPLPDTGPLSWHEMQQMLKAFWMIYIARLLLASLRRSTFELSEGLLHMHVENMRPIDMFGFERQGFLDHHKRNRPRDYLFHAMQLFLTAEEYLQDSQPVDDPPLTTRPLLGKRTIGDTAEAWSDVSETMEHFVRLFKEVRSLEHGDGFHPWRRRLGFAIWDIERLRTAGLVHDPKHDRNTDRVRWLSIIREQDFDTVQSHRLVVSGARKEIADSDNYDYHYPEDSDASDREINCGFDCYWFPEETDRKSLALEFGRQAHGVSKSGTRGM